jgi:stage IV sporulation protein FB
MANGRRIFVIRHSCFAISSVLRHSFRSPFVLLGEPPRSPYDLNFSLLGVPVRVHPLFWLVTLMLGASGDAASVLTWVLAVFVSILVHELGHAAAMRAYGLHPWITLYGFGGQTAYDQSPASRSKASGSLAQVLICLAGPMAGFLLAAALLLGLALAGHGQDIFFIGPGRLMPVVLLPDPRLVRLVNDILFISIVWGIVNLLPVYPLDGGQIAREFLLWLNPSHGIRLSLQLSIAAAVAMAAFGLLQWQSFLVALFFGYLAYSSYAALQAYSSRRPW